MKPPPLALLALAASLPLVACSSPAPPTEPVLVVKSPRAPGLSSPKKNGTSTLTGRAGEVYLLQKSWGLFEWKGTVEADEMTRKSELLQVKRAPRDGFQFLFDEDFDKDVPLPTAGWICSTSPTPIQVTHMACPDVLMRIRIDAQTTAAHVPCQGDLCPLGLVRGSKATWINTASYRDLRTEKLAGRPVLVAHQGIHRGKVSGNSITILDAAPGLAVMQQLDINVVDATRLPIVTYRTLVPTFAGDTLTLEGTEREVDSTSNAELSSRRLREVYRASGNKLRRE